MDGYATAIDPAVAFASDDAKWAAVMRRDPAADGVFFCAVKTTGIYCRPTCPARPHRENVRFYASGAEAERAGFRACKRCRPNETRHLPPAARVAQLDWQRIAEALDAHGCTVVGGLLGSEECAALVASYADDALFRKRIVMQRHGYGQGEYRYFDYPLPDIVASLREAFYAPLAEIANRWNAAMRIDVRYPATHAAFLDRCHAAGQTRATPLMLCYGVGDYNCLHQDLYGEHVFPLQVACLLSRTGRDFTGGEFVLTEQRPRRQSRVEVVPLDRGDAVVFPVRQRPVAGPRGHYRVNLRHGVSRLRSGHRHTLGIIFHDAR